MEVSEDRQSEHWRATLPKSVTILRGKVGMIPICSRLVRDAEVIPTQLLNQNMRYRQESTYSHEGIIRDNWTLSNESSAVHLVSASLEQTVPVLESLMTVSFYL